MDREKGVIKVQAVKNDGSVTVEFEDNGIGMPEMKIETKNHFGLKLVDLLVKQIGGHYRVETNNGTRFIIEFKTGQPRSH